jgi:8-oxo-dGTP pyrophosphatase MutT (NUDIX family)
MAENQGLPYKMGQKMSNAVAEKLVTPEELSSLPALTIDQAKAQQDAAAKEMLEEARIHPPVPPTPPQIPDLPKQIAPPPGESATGKPVEENTSEKKPEDCPRCGWRMGEALLDKPTPEDAHNFLRHITVEDQDFHKCYEMFGGRIKVWFRTRQLELGDQLRHQHQLNYFSRYQGDPRFEVLDQQRLMMACSIVRLEKYNEDGNTIDVREYPEVNDKNYPAPPVEKDKTLPPELATCVGRAENSIFNKMPEVLHMALFMSFKKYEAICAFLLSRSNDSDFYKATTPSA